MLAEDQRRAGGQTPEEHGARPDAEIAPGSGGNGASAQTAARVHEMLAANQTILGRLRWVSAFKYITSILSIPVAVALACLTLGLVIAAPAQWMAWAGPLLGALLAGGISALLLRRRHTDTDAVFARHLDETRLAVQADGRWLALLDEGRQAALRDAVVERLPWAGPLLPPLSTLEQRLRLIAWFQPALARRGHAPERLTAADCAGPALLAWLDGIISAPQLPGLVPVLALLIVAPLPGTLGLVPLLLIALLLAAVAGPLLASRARVEALLQHWLAETAGTPEAPANLSD